MILNFFYLHSVADVDEEGPAVRRDGYPASVLSGDLQAGGTVGAENRHDLRVGVLSETGEAAAVEPLEDERAGRVVVQPEYSVTLLLRHHLAQAISLLHPEALRHQLQNLSGEPLHGDQVLAQRRALKKKQSIIDSIMNSEKKKHTKIKKNFCLY